ncbi:MAG: right-handed parallel beta-helix repeat-containing protein [Planctomycetia bacterium]|nr:right-handed parallel beta-helix repeat-containing protein [Planctomycetia bacterium]
MRKRAILLQIPIVLSFLLFAFLPDLESKEIYVSPKGDDSGMGTKEAPVQTLERARNLARSARKAEPDQPISILLHPGIYMITKPVEFSQPDTGSKEAPLVIKGIVDPANPKAKPHLVGGKVVPNWKKSSFNGRNDVWEADLNSLAIKSKFHQIYLNGTRQIWARYPNYDPNLPYSGGWAYVDGVRPPMYTDIPGERCDTVVLRKKDARKWSAPSEGEVCIFPRYNWWNRIERIKNYDPESRTITLARNMQYAARPEDRFAVFGMKEELDAPGEWYQDLQNGKLYFLPPEGTDMDQAVITVPLVPYSIRLLSVNYVKISGLEFSCAEEGAVLINSCSDCAVEKSLIHDIGYFYGSGVNIQGGFRCAVRGCDIWNVGGHGVGVYAGNGVKMIKCEHIVDNCYIHHAGQFNRHGLGLMAGGTGYTFSHNLIHDVPRCGIFHGGVLHSIEYNRIRHCNLEMEDTGCTYTGGWSGGWSTIRYNHCTDSIGFNNHGKFFVFCWGIYLDESGCAYDVYGNIVERAQAGAMHLHNARENHITNNIFANNAGREGKNCQLSLQGWNDSPNGVFLKDRQSKMLVNHNKLLTNPEWKKMRGMHVSPEDPFLPDGTIMRGNKIERNIFYFPGQPESTYVRASNCNFEYNLFDYNLVWNGGKTPIKTERKGLGTPVAQLTDKIPNYEFAPADPESIKKNPLQTPAKGWTWYHKTFPEMEAEIIGADGAIAPVSKGDLHFFRLKAAFNPKNKYIKYACIRSSSFKVEPGKDYQLSFDMKLTDAKGSMFVRPVSEGNGLWKALGSASINQANGVVRKCRVPFHYPAEGEKEFDKRLGDIDIQFEFMSKTGYAEFGNLCLEEVKQVSEWESWQQEGADVHSIVADPLFVDPEHGDFHLQPNSPAFKLGFKPIPIDEIGPYQDEARVSWPIQEAEGVREHPEWLTSVPITE